MFKQTNATVFGRCVHSNHIKHKLCFSRFNSVSSLIIWCLNFFHIGGMCFRFLFRFLYMSMFNVAMYTLIVSVIFAISSILSPSFRLQLALDESEFGIRIGVKCFKICHLKEMFENMLIVDICLHCSRVWIHTMEPCWKKRMRDWSIGNGSYHVVETKLYYFFFHAIPKLTVLLKFQTFNYMNKN